MSDVTIKVLGIAQAVKNLEEMSRRIQINVTRRSVRAATRDIANAVKATTYGAGRQQRSGLLLKSQAIAISTRTRGLVVGKLIMRKVNVSGQSKVARLVRSTKGGVLRRAGRGTQGGSVLGAFYWKFLERGTRQRTTKSGAGRGLVTPRKWVEPAFDAHTSTALGAFAKTFSSETEAEARKLNTGVTK